MVISSWRLKGPAALAHVAGPKQPSQPAPGRHAEPVLGLKLELMRLVLRIAPRQAPFARMRRLAQHGVVAVVRLKGTGSTHRDLAAIAAVTAIAAIAAAAAAAAPVRRRRRRRRPRRLRIPEQPLARRTAMRNLADVDLRPPGSMRGGASVGAVAMHLCL